MPEDATSQGQAQPSPETGGRTDLLLWLSILLGPLAAGMNVIVGFTVAHYVCDVNRKTTDYLVCLIDFILCLSAAALGLSLQRRLQTTDDTQPNLGRQLFMARMGMILSVFSALIVLAGTIAVITLDPCD